MPTYEYRCGSCGYLFEKFQSMKEDPLQDCPQCCEPALQRLIGAGAGLLFKGSGFYLTDYRKSGTSPATKSDDASTQNSSMPADSAASNESSISSGDSGNSERTSSTKGTAGSNK